MMATSFDHPEIGRRDRTPDGRDLQKIYDGVWSETTNLTPAPEKFHRWVHSGSTLPIPLSTNTIGATELQRSRADSHLRPASMPSTTLGRFGVRGALDHLRCEEASHVARGSVSPTVQGTAWTSPMSYPQQRDARKDERTA